MKVDLPSNCEYFCHTSNYPFLPNATSRVCLLPSIRVIIIGVKYLSDAFRLEVYAEEMWIVWVCVNLSPNSSPIFFYFSPAHADLHSPATEQSYECRLKWVDSASSNWNSAHSFFSLLLSFFVRFLHSICNDCLCLCTNRRTLHECPSAEQSVLLVCRCLSQLCSQINICSLYDRVEHFCWFSDDRLSSMPYHLNSNRLFFSL